ncbi:MAG: hypothetical protein PF694_01350 [Bacteroidetes bacterium]|jgi:hypothetical protein|nr:hypothetical protein [Bacteroidota bacterium]
MRNTVFVLFLSLVLLGLLSCDKMGSQLENQAYVIKVDSIHMPDTVAAGASFTIHFFGIAGSDGCHSFKEFIVSEDSTQLNLLLKGNKIVSEDIACTQALVMLDGLTYSHKFTLPGRYMIEVTNPGISNFLRRPLVVTAP